MHSNLEDSVLLAERVEQRIHGVEHGDHLHRSDVAANASKSHHVAEEDGHIWEHLEDRDKKVNERQRERERQGKEALVGHICVYAFTNQKYLTVHLIFTVAKSLKET